MLAWICAHGPLPLLISPLGLGNIGPASSPSRRRPYVLDARSGGGAGAWEGLSYTLKSGCFDNAGRQYEFAGSGAGRSLSTAMHRSPAADPEHFWPFTNFTIRRYFLSKIVSAILVLELRRELEAGR